MAGNTRGDGAALALGSRQGGRLWRNVPRAGSDGGETRFLRAVGGVWMDARAARPCSVPLQGPGGGDAPGPVPEKHLLQLSPAGRP